MGIQSLGIDAGDAVVTFLADTQNLDQAFDDLDTVPGKLIPVENSLQGLSSYFGQVGESAQEAGSEMEEAGESASGSMHEATGSAHLLGHAIGVHLPRQVYHFLGSLEGIQPILAAAFSAVAIGFLANAVIEITHKITDWVADTFIFTEAMKAQNEEIAKANKSILEQKDAFDKAQKSVAEFGLHGAALTKKSIDELIDSMLANRKTLEDGTAAIFLFNQGMTQYSERAKQAQADTAVLNATLKTQEEQLLLLSKEWEKQKTEEAVRAGEQRIAAERKINEAEAELTMERFHVLLTVDKAGYFAQVVNMQEFENTKYRLQVESLQAQIALQSKLGKDGATKQKELDAELEVLQKNHLAKILKSYAELMGKVAELKKEVEPTLSSLGDEIKNPLTEAFKKATEAADQLGFAFSGQMSISLMKAKESFEALRKTGMASQSDLLKGQIALTKAQIEYDRILGLDVTKEEKALKDLEKVYEKLTHTGEEFTIKLKHAQTNEIRAFDQELEKSGKQSQAWGAAVGTAVAGVAQAYLEGGISIGKALEQMAAAQLKAVAQVAFTKGTEQLAEAFGSYPDMAGVTSHMESAGLWFALGGAMSLGAGAMSGSGPMGGGGSSSSSSSFAPVNGSGSSGSAGGGQTINIQKFAAGGLISGPTLGLMGEGGPASAGNRPREAAIPLDDPQAVGAIKDALGGGGHTIAVGVKGLISSDHLNKLVKQISKGVRKGKFNLQSTNTYRTQRRSQ